MKYDSYKHHRRSIRLRGYDYSRTGLYFVTICTDNHQCLFGDIINDVMILNDAGMMVENCWNDIPTHFPHAELDEYVIMPNHVHGIISIRMGVDGNVIDGDGGNDGNDGIVVVGVGAKNFSPLRDDRHQPRGTSKTIGSIIRGFKIGVTNWMRQNTTVYDVWQRNYWEHIIRNENELDKIRTYISNNPLKWQDDKLYDYHVNGNGMSKKQL